MKKIILKKENSGIGKRKQAVATVFLCPGRGEILINNIPGNQYFQKNTAYLNILFEPLVTVNLRDHIDIVAVVKGGGLVGQSYAIQLGIARQLCKINDKIQPLLKSFGFLRRDSRIKERKKYGLRKARKAPQYSKR